MEQIYFEEKRNLILAVYGETVRELVLAGGGKIILGTIIKESISGAMKKLVSNPAS